MLLIALGPLSSSQARTGNPHSAALPIVLAQFNGTGGDQPTPQPTPSPGPQPTLPPGPSPTPVPTADPGTPADVAAWQRWETRLTARRAYANPFADVSVEVLFDGPGGQQLRTAGFWDGGQTYVARAFFPAPGTWTWRTSASTGDDGLAASGTIEVGRASDATELSRRGAVRVSSNGRYLVYADGTPFFWLADTAWDAPMRATYAGWQRYVDDRVARGFTVIQIAPSPAWFSATDAAGNPPFLDESITLWNPRYWQGFDQKVQYANQRGLLVAVMGLQDPLDDRWPPAEDAARFARQLVGRLHGNQVLFAPAFDKPYDELSDLVGGAIRDVTQQHLITQHPATPSGSVTNTWSELWAAQPYLDVKGVQTGHNDGNRALVFAQAIDWPLSLYNGAPTRPVLNLESFYDSNGAYSGGGLLTGTALDARATAYLSLLSGACGYSYGAQGLIIWDTDPDAPGYWERVLDWPSASQMTVLRSIWGELSWWRLVPAPERVANQGWPPQVMAVAVVPDQSLAVAYLPDNDALQLDLSGWSGAYAVEWIATETGSRQAGGAISAGGVVTLERPGAGDWLVILRRAPA
jgi:hypothetical protein